MNHLKIYVLLKQGFTLQKWIFLLYLDQNKERAFEAVDFMPVILVAHQRRL